MKKMGFFLLMTSFCVALFADDPVKNDPPRLRRADCFLGVHFDFHAEADDVGIGQNTTPEMVNALIDIVHPDFFEVDTKGHPGYSSYPTKVGNHNGKIIGDPLRVWREVTAARGVSLFAHYSSLWDQRAFELHPEWAAKDAAGNPISGKMSTAGPYVETLMIPQLIELGKDYGLDGAWVDGDDWCFVHDFSPAVKEEFTKETGIEKIPTDSSDPNWHVWSNFQRERFRKYLAHYIAAVKKEVPGFQFCSNGAFYTIMPEAPCGGVDFLSADTNGVISTRCIPRLFSTQEMAWDLMSWSFTQWSLKTLDPPETRRSAVQLMQEAGGVIALGGGYQAVFSQAPAGYPPKRDGSVDIEKVRLFGEVAKFCRARQEVCFKAKPIPQVALLFPTEGIYHGWDAQGTPLFWGDRWQDGITSCLVEDHQAVSILVTEKLMKRADEFPVIVVFQWDYVEPEMVERLTEYAQNGGRLYLVGPEMPKMFKKLLSGASNVISGQAPEGRTLDYYLVGKGLVALTPQKNPPVEFVNAAIHELFPNPIVKIDGNPAVDMALMRTVKGEMAIHLVNNTCPAMKNGVFTELPPVGPVKMTVRLAQKPKSVRLEPDSRAIDSTYADGKLSLTVESVPIHEIVVVEEGDSLPPSP